MTTPELSKKASPMIAPDVEIAPNVQLSDGLVVRKGAVIEKSVVFAEEIDAQTIVSENVRIGAGAVVGAGVLLNWGCLVRPGSVVLASVPPNAIVEGNPAQIVGYTSPLDAELPEDGPLAVTDDKTTRLQSQTHHIGVGGAMLHELPRVFDLRGGLSVGEFERDLPFAPQRFFLVFDVPSEELRGEHAHKECHQFLVCVHGSCRTLLDNGVARREVLLDRPNLGLHMPPRIWGTQFRYTQDAVLLVLASHPYDPEDYVRTYDDFQALIGEQP